MTTYVEEFTKIAQADSGLAVLTPIGESPYFQQSAASFSALAALGEPLIATITSPALGDTIVYDGTKWVNTAQVQNLSGKLKVNSVEGLVCANAALATGATKGFIYLPSCAGVPSGTPTTETGTVACVVDTTNKRVYLYLAGAWFNLVGDSIPG